jgi:hypothetical protein
VYSVQGDTNRSVPAPSETDTALRLLDKPSIAVLPFQAMAGDPDQDYLADGVVEAITTARRAYGRFLSSQEIPRPLTFSVRHSQSIPITLLHCRWSAGAMRRDKSTTGPTISRAVNPRH